MADILSKTQRSKLMSTVRSRDTKPEWILRCGLHRIGFRYRLQNSHLPGSPDLIFPKYQSVVFVHGCYWHRHEGCKDATMPKTNVDFWKKKFSENLERDRRIVHELKTSDWRVLVVWECELNQKTIETIHRVANWLVQGKEFKDCDITKNGLLSVAEKKVRYRISSYDEESKHGEKNDKAQ
jgi:DNA mismatch endonuclease, patch repair protein